MPINSYIPANARRDGLQQLQDSLNATIRSQGIHSPAGRRADRRLREMNVGTRHTSILDESFFWFVDDNSFSERLNRSDISSNETVQVTGNIDGFGLYETKAYYPHFISYKIELTCQES